MADLGGPGLTIRSETRNGAVVVAPVGDVDLTGSPVLRQALKQVQSSRPRKLVVDLGAVPYMDSSGLATLVEAMQVARKNGTTMILCALQEKVRSIMEIARLDTIFTIEPTTESAISA